MKPNTILLHTTGQGWQLYAIWPGGRRELLVTFEQVLGLALVRKLAGIAAVNYQCATFEED